MDNLEQTVHQVVTRIVREKSAELSGVENRHSLTADLGLESLDIARIVATLELKLGADPFARLVAITDVRTVGDLCAAYRKALSAPGAVAAPESFASSVKRAEARRGTQRPPEAQA